MGRPKPTLLLEAVNKKNLRSEQVLEATAIWAVFYKGKPINLKLHQVNGQTYGPKYKKVSFSNSGHALNLAKRLNKLFNTLDFEVYELTNGEKVKPKS